MIGLDGKLVKLKTFATSALNPNKLTKDLLRESSALIEENKNIVGIGLASAGRVDFKNKRVVYATDNLKNWADVPIISILEKELKLPVVIDNDVNAALLCDLKLNPSCSNPTVTIFLTIGTGLGGAVAYNGKIVRGNTGSVGEFGHMILYPNGEQCNCGKRGCAEQYISGKAYKRLLQNELHKLGGDCLAMDITLAAIQENIFNGNKPYINILKIMIANLALLLENIKNCIDFDICVLGGSFSVYEEIILNMLKDEFSPFTHKYSAKPRFVFSRQGNTAGVIGAGLMVFEHEGGQNNANSNRKRL